MRRKGLFENMRNKKLLTALSLFPMIFYLALIIYVNIDYARTIGIPTFKWTALLGLIPLILLPIFSLSPTRLGKLVVVLCFTSLMVYLSLEQLNEVKFDIVYPYVFGGITLYYGLINLFSLDFRHY